jgi:hypothetical protein
VTTLEDETPAVNVSLGSSDLTTIVNAVLTNINNNGVWFGGQWWIGEMFNNLYFFDNDAKTYYAMKANNTVVL